MIKFESKIMKLCSFHFDNSPADKSVFLIFIIENKSANIVIEVYFTLQNLTQRLELLLGSGGGPLSV